MFVVIKSAWISVNWFGEDIIKEQRKLVGVFTDFEIAKQKVEALANEIGLYDNWMWRGPMPKWYEGFRSIDDGMHGLRFEVYESPIIGEA